jgi:hypothetical protein
MSREYEKATQENLAELNGAARLLAENPLAFVPTPGLAEAMRKTFEAWAWMGGLTLDMLNRQGGPETIRMAREIIKMQKELK